MWAHNSLPLLSHPLVHSTDAHRPSFLHRSSSSTASTQANAGSLYLAGFQQGGQIPHVAVIVATDASSGHMVHITTKGTGTWHYAFQPQNIASSMGLTSLWCIYDASQSGAQPFHPKSLDAIAKNISVPTGSESGECVKWVNRLLKKLVTDHIIALPASVDTVLEQFVEFARENRGFATRTAYPKIKI
ncbi:hypothetical protein NMY22_g16266 [Coprinellus aureogranulatus]|nr:hypothetical protein NMY22_g16266 [Coprinellus aureogranulatus]